MARHFWPRGTGYEVMLYNCMAGDPMLFSRTDLSRRRGGSAAHPGRLGGSASGRLSQLRGRNLGSPGGQRVDRPRRPALVRDRQPRDAGAIALFRGGDPLFEPGQYGAAAPGSVSWRDDRQERRYRIGDVPDLPWRGRGLDGGGRQQAVLRDGDCFGEVALYSEPRTATVRAKTECDLFVLEKAEFGRIMRDHQQFAEAVKQIAMERYNRSVAAEHLISPAQNT